MASVPLSTEQIIELVRQLPPKQKREVLLALAGKSEAARDSRMALADRQLRRLAAERNLDWVSMSDDERQTFVDDLVHEDRSCLE